VTDQGEELSAVVIDECKDKMRKAVEHLKGEFGGVRTGRANAALVDKLKVDYYGTETLLQQLAGFSVPEPRVLVISPYDKSSMKAIERAIQGSDLGITPNNDGAVIRLVFPELTQDRRRELVRVVKHRAEEARVAIRNIRRDANKQADLEQSEKVLTEDDLATCKEEIQNLTKQFEGKVNEVADKKSAEIMEV
jgi:ribosome recycling factor